MKKSQNYFCSDCKYVGASSKIKKGTRKAEIFWWIMFTPIAIFYSLYRIFGATKCCQSCGSLYICKINSKILHDNLNHLN